MLHGQRLPIIYLVTLCEEPQCKQRPSARIDMPGVAIRVEGLSKSYRIGRTRGRSSYKTLQEEIVGLPRRVTRALRSATSPARHDTERF
jgi:hypothetical protein